MLTLMLLTWTIWRAPTNANKWGMGFNSAFKGLIEGYSYITTLLLYLHGRYFGEVWLYFCVVIIYGLWSSRLVAESALSGIKLEIIVGLRVQGIDLVSHDLLTVIFLGILRKTTKNLRTDGLLNGI